MTAALAALDHLALADLRGADAVRHQLAEARLDALAGRTTTAVRRLGEVAAQADALGGALGGELADAARTDLVVLALRAGRLRAADERAGELEAGSGRAAIVRSAAHVAAGDRAAAADLDRAADDLLRAEGADAAGLLADTAGLALVWAERHDDADRLLGRLGRLARGEGPTGALASVLAVQSFADLRTNRYRSAAARADEAVRLADATERPGLATLAVSVLAVAEAVRGDRAGCRAAADRLVEDGVRTGGRGVAAADVAARAAVGLLHLGTGEPERAVAELRPLHGPTATAPWLIMWQMDLAEALVRTGEPDRAAAVLGDFRAALGDRGGRAGAAADRVEALLAADEPERAEGLLARSEEALRALGAPFGVGRTLLVRGELRRRWGHERAGRADLDRAAALLRSIGAEGWAAQADDALAAPGTAPRAPLVDPLTPQELQVATLVVTGRSNQEVADVLVVSVRTVESHLGRIYRKLAIRSRSQLIARADEWGLRSSSTW